MESGYECIHRLEQNVVTKKAFPKKGFIYHVLTKTYIKFSLTEGHSLIAFKRKSTINHLISSNEKPFIGERHQIFGEW